MDFAVICPKFMPDLFNLAKRYTGQAHTADDLVQETLLKGFRHWDSFHQETDDLDRDVFVWLKRILTNTYYTEWQRDQRRAATTEEFVAEFDEASESESEGDEQVKRVMDKLRPIYREVLNLHYVEGKSYREIADQLGIKFVQVQKRLYRARQYIKTFYEQAGLNRSRSPMRVNSAPIETPESEEAEADTVDGIMTRDDTKPLRRRKPAPNAEAAR